MDVLLLYRWKDGIPNGKSILLGLLVGLAAGLLNGVIIAYSNIHPFVVTLANGTSYVVLLTYWQMDNQYLCM